MSSDALTKASTPNYGSTSEERAAIMERSQGTSKRPIDELNEQGLRKVQDPITGGSVKIADSVAGKVANGGNLLYRPFPPSVELELAPILAKIDRLIVAVPVVVALLLVFSSFSLWNVVGLSVCTIAAVWSLGSVRTRITREMDRARAALLEDRAATINPPEPESTAWLNAFLAKIWPHIDPALFVSTIDMVEDIMQQSVPKFIDAVKISDFDLGTNALQVVSMRSLPDETGGKDGDYVNLEIAYSYVAQPGKKKAARSHNIHLLLELFAGVSDWLRIPIRIWAQVEKISGAVRIRLKMSQQFPHVSEIQYTLLGIPELDISVFPVSRKLPDVLDLPGIRGFVRQSIAAGCQAFVAPASGTVDLASIMSPTRIGDTKALGVFMITIHEARDLHDKDLKGKSDPYIVLAYGKFGKPSYSTRVIEHELNPSFEETAFMMLTQNELDAEETLCAMLWDSDDSSSDDLLGRVRIPVKDLIKTPGVMHKREDGLMGFEEEKQEQGHLIWSIGYFPKQPLNKKLERPLPAPAKDAPPPPIDESKPADVLRTPPDQRWPSGVLHVTLHQIFGVERQLNNMKPGRITEGPEGQDIDQPAEDDDNLPSAYAEILVNDDMVYKTRVKQFTTSPFFEAGTEVFVRDWAQTQIRIVVRDAVLRERDPILGIVTLDLAKLLSESSEKTGLYAIQDGIGFGRASVSVLFKSINLELPRPLLGWDTATVEIFPQPITLTLTKSNGKKFKKLVLSTVDGEQKFDKPTTENTWTPSDMIRLPVYTRFASALVIELHDSGFDLVHRGADAIALLWLKDIEEHMEQEIELPVWGGDSDKLATLKENVVTESYRSRHGKHFEQIGSLKVKLRVDPGLDTQHQSSAKSDARRSAFESFASQSKTDVSEGQSEASQHQLRNRQRGMRAHKGVRTLDWMAQGIKDKVKPDKSSKREPAVRTESDS